LIFPTWKCLYRCRSNTLEAELISEEHGANLSFYYLWQALDGAACIAAVSGIEWRRTG
jgi:hypothetical protein